MFPDIGGSELIIVAVIALLVVKPQDLPVMMRKFGAFMAQMRRMANDFRASFDDMARQSELEELRKEVEAMRASAADHVSTTNAEITQGLTFEHDPLDPYGAVGAPLDAPPFEAEAPVTVLSETSIDTPKAKRARRKPVPESSSEVGLSAEEVAPKPRRTRRKTPGDIAT